MILLLSLSSEYNRVLIHFKLSLRVLRLSPRGNEIKARHGNKNYITFQVHIFHLILIFYTNLEHHKCCYAVCELGTGRRWRKTKTSFFTLFDVTEMLGSLRYLQREQKQPQVHVGNQTHNHDTHKHS